MSTRDRQALDDWCREQMGPERARTLMELLPHTKARTSWWRPADPEQSFWVQHGTGFFIGEPVGVWTMLLVMLLARH